MTKKRAAPDARAALVEASRAGSVTLVLGAGVSIAAGVPNWRGLAVRVWQQAIAAPGERSAIDDLDVEKVVQDPQLFPIIFELAAERLGEEAFTHVLRECIYETASKRYTPGANETLDTIADVVTRDYLLGARRRIARVVTFNADELLREALRVQRRKHKLGQFWRTMDHAVVGIPIGRGDQPVPVYHVHGMLPREGVFGTDFSAHRLVFTDSQYWQSGTAQASLANRTMNAALADSHCVFVGLSMTDANLLRWLAIRHNEVARDVGFRDFHMRNTDPAGLREGKTPAEDTASPAVRAVRAVRAVERERERERVRRALSGHFWIRARGDDRTGILTEFLRLRGVDAVEIDAWGDGSFSRLIDECFPSDS